MSTVKSATSLTSAMKKPKISRKHLSRYSWLPDVLRIDGSITLRILGPVLTVTVFASIVAYVWYKGHDVRLSNNVSPLLAVVVGLILVFRNSTSYDRFYEGRKDFGQMVADASHAIRNLSRFIWVNVAVSPEVDDGGKGPAKKKMSPLQLRKAKTDALKLLIAFAYSVKHRLRGEYGIDYADYEGILPRSIARYEEAGFSSTSSSPVEHSGSYTLNPKPKRRKEEKPPSSGVTSPGSSTLSQENGAEHSHGIHFHEASMTLDSQSATTPLLSKNHRTVQFYPYASVSKTPLPLVIAHEVARTVFRFKRDGYLETVGPAGTNAMNTLIQSLIVQLTNMERIATTPIPISYGIHLKQCVTLYLFALPFVLVADLHWKMIPVVTVVAFTLMGIEGIANEIEMPFGTDKTDLPLDTFCAELKDEIDFMIERLPEGGEGAVGYDDGEGDD